MKPTRATPIISAAAVADVRLGLRIAFSRASVPGMPLQAGQRRTDDPADRTGQDRTEHGDTDEHQQRAEADQRQAGTTEQPGAPWRRAPSPVTASRRRRGGGCCRSGRRRRRASPRSAEPSPARRAGNTAEATLTPRPAMIEMMTVLLVSTTPPGGDVDARCPPSIAFSPTATPTPAPRPATRGDEPDGDRLEQHRREHLACGWRRSPAATPSPCVRWATRIEKEL